MSPSGLAQSIANPEASPWLNAVGRLTVPGKQWRNNEWQHHIENCSASLLRMRRQTGSLVNRSNRTLPARYILSAWHCLENYSDLSKDIVFELPNGTVRTARSVVSGGGMNADWVLLKLDLPISAGESFALHTSALPITEPLQISMVGYSISAEAQGAESPLSYDARCKVTSVSPGLIATNCRVSKGASGGAVVVRRNSDYLLTGAVSTGDSEAQSFYVPISAFASALRNFL